MLALAAYGVVNLLSPNSNSCISSNSIPNTNSSTPSKNVAETSPFDIRLPSLPNPFQNQSNKAGQSEAKTYTGSMSRGQQAFYLEKSRFASSLDELAIGVKAETENYSYRVLLNNDANPLNRVSFQIGQSKQPDLKSYVGAVRLAKIKGSTDVTSLAFLCETDSPSKSQPPLPIMVGEDGMQCALGTSLIQ